MEPPAQPRELCFHTNEERLESFLGDLLSPALLAGLPRRVYHGGRNERRNDRVDLPGFELVYGCHIPSPTVMIRRRCIDEVGGFNPAFAFGSQDFEMWVRLARRYAVGYIAEPLAKYRTHTNTMSTTRRLAEIEQSNSRILEAVFSDAELGPLFYSQRSNAYAYLQFRMAERAFSNRPDAKTARKYLFKAIRRHPKGFFENWGLSWIYLFARTWIPRPILTLARRGKRHLQRALLFRRG